MKYDYLFIRITCIILFALLINDTALAQQIAFPTAEGYGKFTTGGRGTATTPTTVYEVTKLTDDGSVGTLRYALTNNSPAALYRTIVFRVSGTIHLTSALKFSRANVTIAGQTAPGDGICLADFPVSTSVDNIIVRYIRFRMGDQNELITTPAGCGVPVAPFTSACAPVNGSGGDDAFDGTYHKNIMVDHCTMSWSNDEACTFYGGDSTTLQWNMLSEPLNYAFHFETGDLDFEHHGYGGIWGGQHATFHHNLLAHCQGRAPRFDGSRNLGNKSTVGLENCDFRNNVIYDWGIYNTNGGEGGNYNIVNNYYKYGPNTSTTSSSSVPIKYMIINPYKQASPVLPYGKYYLTGNYVDGSTANTARNWLGAAMSGGSYADTVNSKVTVPFAAIDVPTQEAADAYKTVLASVGAFLPKRDTLDQRIIREVDARTGRLIDCQGGYPHATPYANTVGAWPTLNALTAPVDSDHDGMPDAWETARGLNPNLATDRYAISSNGYTNLENYLNGDSIIAKGVTNTCIAARSVVSSATGAWLQLADTTSAILISTDTLNLFASIKDDGNYGSFNSAYYTTSTTRYLSGYAYLNRNVTITPTASVSGAVTVRLYITTAEFNALKAADANINSIADVKILLASNTTCPSTLSGAFSVINPTATGSFGTYVPGYFVEFTTTNFGTFFVGGSITTLPLQLLTFTGNLSNNAVDLKWTTANEINVKNFGIEKSTDGINFTQIATVAATNSVTINYYQYTDKSLLAATTYYRLKMVDNNGTVNYSNVVTVSQNLAVALKIYPNPVGNTVTISHQSVVNGTIEIVTADGRKLLTTKVVANTTQTNIDVSRLNAGTYWLVFSNSINKVYSKFIKL